MTCLMFCDCIQKSLWDYNGAQILAVKKREIKIHNNAICDSQNGVYVIVIYSVTRVTSLLL